MCPHTRPCESCRCPLKGTKAVKRHHNADHRIASQAAVKGYRHTPPIITRGKSELQSCEKHAYRNTFPFSFA